MKKVYLMLMIGFITIGLSAQNLVLNPGFENWDDVNNPTSWSKVENVDQESAAENVHSGTYSAKHTGGTSDLTQDIDVVPGTDYTLSFWYKVVESDGQDSRIWCVWLDGSGSGLFDDTQGAIRGPDGGYLDNGTGEWRQYSATVTAPANAAQLSLEVRTYSGAITYWDDFSLEVAAAPPAQLIFSEYIEGSSNNKALEIYNPNAEAVDLSSYQIAQSSNGGGWEFFHVFPEGASIAAENVYVIATDAVDTALYDTAFADEVMGWPSPVHHNGDDARAIVFITDTDTTILDVIGIPDEDPGVGWDVAGVAEATKDHTLIRKDGITQGNTDWAASAGTDAANSEWLVFDQNYFDNLGKIGAPEVAVPLFFSEYIEGSSNNKALEIYNPTAETVALASYQIAQSSNGGGWEFFHVFPEGASIAAENVYVIATDAVDTALYDTAFADEVMGWPSPVHHNGDDARAIVFITDADTTILDVIGIPDEDPGAGWDVAGVAEATKDHTLVRKDDITQGNTDWAASAGTDAANSEWIVFDQNYFDNLGIFGAPEVAMPLFFSEYIEGSSNNKALEIYNPTAETVALASYQIAQSSNGGGWEFFHVFPEGASIAAEDVYVIATDAVDTALYDTAFADEVMGWPSPVHHNGDDARAIVFITDTDTTILDVIGIPDEDPGAGWDVAGVTEATANHTLVRKDSITQGNTDWAASAGTDADNSEWVVYDQNYFDDLGMFGAPEVAMPLFFSEYIEGSSNNKALEIYNPTAESVDLSSYQIAQSNNGGGWEFFHVFPEGSSIAAEDVYVLLNDAVGAELFDAANADEVLSYPSVVHHNGNDARAIVFITDTDTTILDVIGIPDEDPANDWDVAGVTAATKDHTLVRKDGTTQGNTDWASSAGTDADNSEWVVYDQNYFDNLGLFGAPEVSAALSDLLIDGTTVDGFIPGKFDYTNDLPAGTTTVPTVTYVLADESASADVTPASDLAGDAAARTTTVVVTAQDGTTTQTYSITFNPVIEVANLGALRASADETRKYVVTGEVLLSFQQSYRNKKYVQDGTGGIEIDDDPGVITTTFNIGDGITGLEGTIENYNGLLQFHPTADPGAATSNGNEITPTVVTPAQINADIDMYESTLVTVEHATIDEADGTTAFENGDNLTLNGEAESMVLRVHFYDTSLKGTVIPDSANVTGIVIEFNGTAQVSPRSADDVEELVPFVPSDDAALSDLMVDGTSVTGFSPAQLSYFVSLPSGTTDVPVVTVTTSDDNASVDIAPATDLSGDAAARTTSVEVTAEDGVTMKTYTIEFTVEVSARDAMLNRVQIYPVPATNTLHLVNASEIRTLTVYDITGASVQQVNNAGDDRISLDVSSLDSGVYMIRMENEDATRVVRFVKQ